jgi:hypothetical protein
MAAMLRFAAAIVHKKVLVPKVAKVAMLARDEY